MFKQMMTGFQIGKRISDREKGQDNKGCNVSQNDEVGKDLNPELSLSGSGIEKVSASEEENIFSSIKESQKDSNLLSRSELPPVQRVYTSSLSTVSDTRLSAQLEVQSSNGTNSGLNPQTSLCNNL